LRQHTWLRSQELDVDVYEDEDADGVAEEECGNKASMNRAKN